MPKPKKPEQSPMAAKIEKVDVGTKGKIDESLKAQFLSDHVNDRNVRFANMGNKPVFACACCGKDQPIPQTRKCEQSSEIPIL